MWRHVLIGALAAVGVTTFVVVFGAGIYWLWLFGDDPWPTWAGTALVVVAYALGSMVFIGFVAKSIRRNRRPTRVGEKEPSGLS